MQVDPRAMDYYYYYYYYYYYLVFFPQVYIQSNFVGFDEERISGKQGRRKEEVT